MTQMNKTEPGEPRERHAADGSGGLLSPRAATRAFELAVLVYSPLWMAAVAAAGTSGVLQRWGDQEHLALGIGLALPILALAARSAYAARAVLFLVGMTAIQMFLGSILFFDRLGMEYHFQVTWTWNRSPVFLYPLTLAYFATYYVVMQLVVRALPTALARGAPRLFTLAILSYAVALAETAVMASPALAPYFFYRDKGFMLRYGSVCYGTVFFVSLPGFLRLEARARSLLQILAELTWRNAVILGLYRLYALILPHLQDR